tara:strand:- start:220 stop:423 length:204 start_codon:yes stop_codon:yes gene_type:complete
LKKTLFRTVVNIADNIDIFIQEKFNLKPKQRSLELAQDLTTRKNFDKTIGKALGVSSIHTEKKNNYE